MVGILFFKPLDEIVVVDEITDCCKGNCQKDAHDTQHAAADNEGDQDPDRGDTELLTEQTRLDHITVQCLQDQGKNQKQQCVHGLDQYQNEGTQDRTRHGTESGRQIRDTDDHGNDRDIRHIHNDHENPVAQTDDQTIQYIEGNVLNQNPVAAAPESGGVPVHIQGKNRMEKP